MSTSTRDLIIYGAGGFGREILAMSRDGSTAGPDTPRWNAIGFVDDTPGYRGMEIHGISCLGSLNEGASARQGTETWCFIALGDNKKRREAATRIEALGWKAATFVHPTVYIAKEDLKLGGGSVIGPYTTVSPNVTIGRYTLIGTRVSVGHHAVLGDFSQVAVGASILGYGEIGRGAMIGANAVVLPHISVGAWATVGACTPAMASVKPGHTICLPLPRTAFKLEHLPDEGE